MPEAPAAFASAAMGVELVLGTVAIDAWVAVVANHLIANDVLVLTNGCASFPLLKLGYGEGSRWAAKPERHRDGHGRQHVRGVIFLVERPLPNDCSSGRLHKLNPKPVFGVDARRASQDQGVCSM
jgi:hypothetical protein